jgi:hypothetical protein
MLYLNKVQMKKDKFRPNGVLAFMGHMPLFPEKRCPRLKPGDVRNIEITRLSKSKRSGYFVLAGGTECLWHRERFAFQPKKFEQDRIRCGRPGRHLIIP